MITCKRGALINAVRVIMEDNPVSISYTREGLENVLYQSGTGSLETRTPGPASSSSSGYLTGQAIMRTSLATGLWVPRRLASFFKWPLCLSLGPLWTCLQNGYCSGPCRCASPRFSATAAHPVLISLRKRAGPPAAVPDGPGPSPVLPLTHT